MQHLPSARVRAKSIYAIFLIFLVLFLAACGTLPVEEPVAETTETLDANAVWTKIADEKTNFTVSGTQTVRYGAGSSWVQKSVNGSGYCGNWYFGSDPAPGVVKHCEVLSSTGGGGNPPPSGSTWTKIADEKTYFTVSGTKTVRYGVDTRWVQKSVTGTGYCANTFFGSDPADGVVKRCEVLSSGGGGGDPPPPPTPGPTVTISYQKDNGNFLNPERGFTNPQVSYSDNPKSLESWRLEDSKAQGISIMNRRYAMVSFRNSSISQSFLNHIQADLDLVRQYGMKMVLRFSYTFNESSGSYGDASLSRMLSHVEQLRPLLQRNADVIAYVEAGFIGRWGEWNKSSNGLGDETNPQNTSAQRDLVNALLGAVPRERLITLRYVGRKQAIISSSALSSSQAYSGSAQARVGHMNDYFTIDDWSGSDRSYLSQDTQFTVQGGEPGRLNGSRSECTSAMNELTTFHWSTMNMPGGDFESVWRNGGCFDSIARRLGYRFYLKQATLPKSVAPGATLSVVLNMTNEGFARLYNPRALELVLRNRNNGQETRLAINPGQDVRLFLPAAGESKNLTLNAKVSSSLPKGTYDLFVNLPDPSSSLKSRASYSIRLANTNMWESSTGYNKLGSVSIN